MRTTLQIDDDVYQAARSLARAEDKSIGQVISELARKGLLPSDKAFDHGGFPVFDVPLDATPITLEMVQRAGDDE
jgi:hypothetical protein